LAFAVGDYGAERPGSLRNRLFRQRDGASQVYLVALLRHHAVI
jgi:hypothetical protein